MGCAPSNPAPENTLRCSDDFKSPISVVECFTDALNDASSSNDVLNCLVMGDKDKDLLQRINCIGSQFDPSATNPKSDDFKPSSCGISMSQFQCMMGKYNEAEKTSNGTPTQEDMNNIVNCMITDPRNKDILQRMSRLPSVNNN